MSQQHVDIWNAAADAFSQRSEAVTEEPGTWPGPSVPTKSSRPRPSARPTVGLQRFPADMMRNSGMFGPAVEAPDGADEQTRLLLFSGRQV